MNQQRRDPNAMLQAIEANRADARWIVKPSFLELYALLTGAAAACALTFAFSPRGNAIEVAAATVATAVGGVAALRLARQRRALGTAISPVVWLAPLAMFGAMSAANLAAHGNARAWIYVAILIGVIGCGVAQRNALVACCTGQLGLFGIGLAASWSPALSISFMSLWTIAVLGARGKVLFDK
jgi:hypothetical protein